MRQGRRARGEERVRAFLEHWATYLLARLPSSLVPASIQPQALHPVAHRAKCDAQELRGRGAVVARFLERFQDGLLLDAIEVVLQRRLAVAADRSRLLMHVLGRQ